MHIRYVYEMHGLCCNEYATIPVNEPLCMFHMEKRKHAKTLSAISTHFSHIHRNESVHLSGNARGNKIVTSRKKLGVSVYGYLQ